MKKTVSNEEYLRRIKSHTHIDDSGCHLWTAAKNNIGYGFFRYKEKMALAHRVVMELNGHDIKDKMVYHTCGNYHCVNPDHLLIGDINDKVKEAKKRGKAGNSWTNPKYRLKCVHCGVESHSGVIARLHNDKCKQKPQTS